MSAVAVIDDYRWLVSDEAQPWLALCNSGPSLTTLALALRKKLSAERAHLVLEQRELRQRARDKFTLAEQMLFTRKGLEQATDEQIAAYKASRFPEGGSVIDLCCGIGGDLIALSKRGEAQGVERDAVTALLASANLRVYGLQERVGIIVGDAVSTALHSSAWHCDPDRRNEGRRATRGDLFEPPLDALAKLLDQSSDAAIKLAPATEAPAEWRQAAELEWISSRRECRQQVAWFGALSRHPGLRAATVIGTDGNLRTVVGKPDDSAPVGREIGRYLYEPDAAVLAAKLAAVLVEQHSLAAISGGIAYLTSDRLIDDLALDAFELLDVLPLDRKQLKAYCREHRLGRLEIKKRGVELSPDRLRSEIIGDGDEAATIIAATVNGSVRAMIARRLSPRATTPAAP